ncbi:major facilitator superfamily domain-containing protein [Aspergillus pseudocaelatus]|uniref:Major facilitator superfamily domain-containing protein n=1 Tax=Aspergillus pseudocaelatus TaxID=1825620 RepID=A0ABQ6WZQ8_9EURO|nr:major facilitator superfamily domain-containing protein [Aspergillus pseudocaelatus]
MGTEERIVHGAQPDESCSLSAQDRKDTPMEWPWLRKHLILIQCSFLAVCPGFTSSILIPGTNAVAQELGISSQTATYLIAVHVLFLGLAPFFWITCMKAYGRRPILITSTLLSCFAALGGGFAKTYGGLMTARVFQSFGISAGFVLPGVIVVDIFSKEQRGRKNGIWAQMVSIGAPLGGVIGGPVVRYAGWRWALWLSAIMNAVQSIAFILTCPETSDLHRRSGNARFRVQHVLEPFLILQAPHIVFVAFAYGVTFAIVSVGLATIVPLALEDLYEFGAVAQGLFFLGPLVGALIGEQLAGPGSDWIMKRERRSSAAAAAAAGDAGGTAQRLERRLIVGLPGFLIAVSGILIFGLTLQYRTHWMGPCMGFAVANFGLQLVTTPSKTYCVDCLSSHSDSVLQLINTVRQILAFTVPFWSPNLVERLGYGLGYGIEAIILAVFSLGCVLVLCWGELWRNQLSIKKLEDTS